MLHGTVYAAHGVNIDAILIDMELVTDPSDNDPAEEAECRAVLALDEHLRPIGILCIIYDVPVEMVAKVARLSVGLTQNLLDEAIAQVREKTGLPPLS